MSLAVRRIRLSTIWTLCNHFYICILKPPAGFKIVEFIRHRVVVTSEELNQMLQCCVVKELLVLFVADTNLQSVLLLLAF